MQGDDYKGFTRFKMELGQKVSAVRFRFFVFLGTFVFTLSLSFYTFSDKVKVSNAALYGVSSLLVVLQKDEAILHYKLPDGERVPFKVGTYFRQKALLTAVEHLQKNALFSGIGSFFIGLLSVICVSAFFRNVQVEKKQKKTHIRGATIVEPDELFDLIEERGEASNILLGDVPVPLSKVGRHFSFTGDTGVGKSQLLMDVLDVVRAIGDKAIILDKNGELMSHYYDPKRDYVLSPFDDRSLNWTPYCEGQSELDFERLSRSFIPTVTGGKEDHWPEASVTVMTSLLYQLTKQRGFQGTIDELQAAFMESKKVVEVNLLGKKEIVVKRTIYELLKGTLASTVVDQDAAEHASSVIASIIPKIRALRFLRGLENRKTFSIREWVKNDNDKGWLFLRVTEEQLEVVRPLISTWIDTAIKSALSLEKSPNRVIWAVIDELQSMGKINTLPKALTEGRKHGLRCILSFPSVNQLFSNELYGEHLATAMLSQCNTKVIFQTDEPKAAKWNAELLGMEEVIKENESTQYGDKQNRGINEQDKDRFIVMPAEVQSLAPFTAYLKFAGNWPVTKIKTSYRDRRIVAPSTVERVLPPPFVLSESESVSSEVIKPTQKTDMSTYRHEEPLI